MSPRRKKSVEKSSEEKEVKEVESVSSSEQNHSEKVNKTPETSANKDSSTTDKTDNEKDQNNKVKDTIREVEIDISQLLKMPIRELYKLARKYSITGYTQMAKKDLIFAVLKAQTESYGYFFAEGVLEITDGGYGFLRTLDNNLLPSSNDIYVSQSQIRRFNLNTGDWVAGQVRSPKEGEKYFALLRIEAINQKPVSYAEERISFQNLVPVYPDEKFILETEPYIVSTRIIDLFSPIGKGQRGLIVAPPKAGKTTLLKDRKSVV